jgi:hypothetical protein
MIIRIKGKLPDHIWDMGVRPGQRYDAHVAPDTNLDARRFIVVVDGQQQYCTVFPKNYDEI